MLFLPQCHCTFQKACCPSVKRSGSGSETPLLVDFYAAWCGPCQFIVPELSVVSKRLEGRVKVVKIDTEKYPKLASRYSIQALPTLVLFKEGKPIDRIEGFLTGQQLVDRLNYMLANHASP